MQPTELRLSTDKRTLHVSWPQQSAALPAELLRVESPSAEVRGHGLGEKKLVTGKKDVTITNIEPSGTYAVRLTFSDGHRTGIYTWDFLHHMAINQESLWQAYQNRLAQAGQPA